MRRPLTPRSRTRFAGRSHTRQVQPYLHNSRHRGLSLDSAFWLLTDSSDASPPFQGFEPTHPTIPRSLEFLLLPHFRRAIKRAVFAFRNFAYYRIRALLYAGNPNWELLATISPIGMQWAVNRHTVRAFRSLRRVIPRQDSRICRQRTRQHTNHSRVAYILLTPYVSVVSSPIVKPPSASRSWSTDSGRSTALQ